MDKTIEQLEKEPIIGNAHHDQHILDGCHEVIISSVPMETKCRAIKLIDKVMGEETETPITETDVNEYLEGFE